MSPSATLLIAGMLLFMFCWNISWAALMFVVASEVRMLLVQLLLLLILALSCFAAAAAAVAATADCFLLQGFQKSLPVY